MLLGFCLLGFLSYCYPIVGGLGVLGSFEVVLQRGGMVSTTPPLARYSCRASWNACSGDSSSVCSVIILVPLRIGLVRSGGTAHSQRLRDGHQPIALACP
jgi:hypothetical protein